MYRIILKVNRVSIRIRGIIPLQILIKHASHCFYYAKHLLLQNGKGKCNTNSEFFLNQQQPYFDILIHFQCDHQTKLAGKAIINLLKWQENSSNLVEERLQCSPDSKASINFDLIYMFCPYIQFTKNLITAEQVLYQSQSCSQLIKEGDKLGLQNKKLQQTLENLQIINKGLNNLHNRIEQEHKKKDKWLTEELKIKGKEELSSRNSVNTLKNQNNQLKKQVSFNRKKIKQNQSFNNEETHSLNSKSQIMIDLPGEIQPEAAFNMIDEEGIEANITKPEESDSNMNAQEGISIKHRQNISQVRPEETNEEMLSTSLTELKLPCIENMF